MLSMILQDCEKFCKVFSQPHDYPKSDKYYRDKRINNLVKSVILPLTAAVDLTQSLRAVRAAM